MPRSSNDFVDLLKLRGQGFASVSLDGVLIATYDFSAAIWHGQRMYEFVDHGVDHSYRVAECALEILQILLPKDEEPTPIERLVLGVGCLIHDIGMQYDKYPVGGNKKSAQEIRSNHCELGYEMISQAVDGTFDTKRAGPSLSLDEMHKMFVGYGALVGFSHGGMTYLNRLRDSQYANRKEGGLQILRLRLLAAVLRLADELHTEYTRIPELGWIATPLLTPKQRAHWAACYYIQELRLTSPGPAGLRVWIKWRVPNDTQPDETAIIRGLLQELRERKIASEFDVVKEFLKWREGMDECFFECSLDPEPERVSIQHLPSEVSSFVSEELRPYQFGLKQLPSFIAIKELPGSPDIETARSQARTFFLSGEGTLRGHYRLKTGWHTNTYVRCRDLTANRDFSTVLCRALATEYSDRGFSYVLSVGTSAIKVGSWLSFLLGVNHSFTFGDADIRGELAGREDYTEYEREVLIPPNASVLIIDDILGVGSVLEKIVTRLGELAKPPKAIRIFCIYVLGDLGKASERLTGVEVDYLIAFPDVLYWIESNPTMRICEICKSNPNIAHDE